MSQLAKNILAIGSGKGGVGKSTVAANLALALQAEGASVAFLDADLYGPSAPTMFGISGEKPKMSEDQSIVPINKYNLNIMSIGFLVPEEEAIIWRGPMLGKMLQQFLQQVQWGEPDYLLIDLPPGTGDIQLSLAQIISVNAAIIVTTPQDVALADVRRSVKMFEKTNIPILGIIENMSYFEAPDTKARYQIFGGGADKAKINALGTKIIGELPLEIATRQATDAGEPIMVRDPEGEQAKRFRAIAAHIIATQESEGASDGLELPDVGDAYK